MRVASRVSSIDLELTILESYVTLEKSQHFIEFCLVPSPPAEMKISSVEVKISWKTEIELLSYCAISYKN